MITADELLDIYKNYFLEEIAEAGIDFDASAYHEGMEAGISVCARAGGVSNADIRRAIDDYNAKLFQQVKNDKEG